MVDHKYWSETSLTTTGRKKNNTCTSLILLWHVNTHKCTQIQTYRRELHVLKTLKDPYGSTYSMKTYCIYVWFSLTAQSCAGVRWLYGLYGVLNPRQLHGDGKMSSCFFVELQPASWVECRCGWVTGCHHPSPLLCNVHSNVHEYGKTWAWRPSTGMSNTRNRSFNPWMHCLTPNQITFWWQYCILFKYWD